MDQPIFITGIGTGVGKTIVSAIVAEALEADYWKPVQAGFEEGTDAELVKALLTNTRSVVHYEVYKLKLPASPHIAAREEGFQIDLDKIAGHYDSIAKCSPNVKHIVIEGAGGVFVPLNEDEFILDLIKKLNAKVILVSRNYLGSINHSLLTAKVCKQNGIDVLGWIFNDQFMDYQKEIEKWTNIPVICSIPKMESIKRKSILYQAILLRKNILQKL